MPAKIKILNSEEGYELAAKKYDEMEGYLNSFEQDNVFYLLKDIKGKKILDVGAGTGRISTALQRNGGEVTSLDLSKKNVGNFKTQKSND